MYLMFCLVEWWAFSTLATLTWSYIKIFYSETQKFSFYSKLKIFTHRRIGNSVEGKMESLECSVYLGQSLFSGWLLPMCWRETVKHMMIYIIPVIDNSVHWHSDRVFCQHLWHWSLILLKSHRAIMHWLIYHYLKIIMQNIIKYPIFKILSHIYAISIHRSSQITWFDDNSSNSTSCGGTPRVIVRRSTLKDQLFVFGPKKYILDYCQNYMIWSIFCSSSYPNSVPLQIISFVFPASLIWVSVAAVWNCWNWIKKRICSFHPGFGAKLTELTVGTKFPHSLQ